MQEWNVLPCSQHYHDYVGIIARPVDTTGGIWNRVTLRGTHSTTVLPQEIHAKEWDTVTHYKLIPVGIPQYSCTVIVFNLTGNICSATLACYCLGSDKEPLQLNNLTKTCRIFTSPVSLTQKTPLCKVHRYLYAFLFWTEEVCKLKLKKKFKIHI